MIVTWEEDGHTDHEVLARTVVAAAGAWGVRCLQYPVWFWHWGSPTRLPRGLEDRDTAAVVSGSKETAASFTERWVLTLDGHGDWPWRIASAAASAAA